VTNLIITRALFSPIFRKDPPYFMQVVWTTHSQRPWKYLLHKPSIAVFVANFVAMATGVGRRKILSDI